MTNDELRIEMNVEGNTDETDLTIFADFELAIAFDAVMIIHLKGNAVYGGCCVNSYSRSSFCKRLVLTFETSES